MRKANKSKVKSRLVHWTMFGSVTQGTGKGEKRTSWWEGAGTNTRHLSCCSIFPISITSVGGAVRKSKKSKVKSRLVQRTMLGRVTQGTEKGEKRTSGGKGQARWW